MTQRFPALVFICILFLAFIIYRPGLQGTFLFDDYVNLDKLGEFNGVRNVETFKRFVLGGIGGPTGRPIALLSFLLNDTNWPSDPYPFKLTNVLLHLLTAAVLFGVIQRLVSIRPDQIEPKLVGWVAAFATASWLLHPFFVSTTLYVVQRMAMLSALFIGIGLLSYIHGRCLLKRHPGKAYGWMSFSVIACTLLALFSKENGALLPVLLLVVEWSVLQDKASGLAPLNRIWKIVFLWTPVFLLVYYIVSGLITGKIAAGYSARPFNLPERVLTQSRVIFDYLHHLFIPQMYSRGLYNENFPVSNHLFSPLSTFVALVGVTMLLGGAFYFKKRFPFFALAIIFFFTGHIIESSVFPLELYFEHRNYLPSFFLYLPLIQLFVCFPTQKSVAIIIVSAWIAVLAVFTLQRSILWGNTNELALLWAMNNPSSQRAQVTAALSLEHSGKPRMAMEVLERATANLPDNIPIKMHLLAIQCANAEVTAEVLDSANHAFATIPYNFRTFNLLQFLVGIGLSGGCQGVSSAQIASILKALSSNPMAHKNKRAQFQLDHLLGLVYTHQGKRDEAFERFEQALSNKKDIEVGLVQVAVLATHGFYHEALLHLNATEKLMPRTKRGSSLLRIDMFKYSHDYRDDIVNLRDQITKDLELSLNTS